MSWPHKAIAWCFRLLFAFVPLIFLPNTSELFEFNKIILLYIFTVLIVNFWLSRMVIERKWIFRRTLLDWPLLIFLIFQLVSLLFSIDPRTSWMGYYSRFNGGFLSLLCYSLLYWSAVTHLDKKSTLSTLNWALVTASLVAFYGILEHFGIDKNLWVQDVQTRVFSTLGQPNWLAAYVSALIFIPISNLFLDTSPKTNRRLGLRSYLQWSLFIMLFLTLLFTKSKSGLAAFGISWIIFWAIQTKLYGFKIFKNYLILSIWCLVFLFSLLIPTPFRDQFFSKFPGVAPQAANKEVPGGTSLESGGTNSGTIRKIVWQGALDIWKSTPKTWWLGTGPETFAMAYYQHRPIAHNSTSEWELLYNKAHNEFLNYLATTGVLGLVSYLILLGFMCYFFIKSDLVHSALFAGWLTIPLTNFWGFSVVIVQILMFLLPAFAVTLNITPDKNNLPARRNIHPFLFLIFGCPALLLIILILRYWLADTHYAAGQKFLRSFTISQDPTYLYTSYQEYLSAFQLNAADPPITADLSIVSAYLAVLAHETQPELSSNLLVTALTSGRQAIAANPYHPNYYKSLSRTYIVLSSMDEKFLADADRILAAAQEISPTDPRIPYNRGIIAQYRKDYPGAAQYFSSALKLKPDFADPKSALESIATLSATTR